MVTTRARIDDEGSQSDTRIPEATAARHGTNRSADKRQASDERSQMPSSILAVWSASSRSDGVLAGRVVQAPCTAISTGPASADGVGHRSPPARRAPPIAPLRNASQDGIGLPPSLVVRQPRQQHRHRAPADLGGEQTIHGSLQHRRMVSGFGERISIASSMTGSSAMTRRTSSRRTGCVAGISGPASANMR